MQVNGVPNKFEIFQDFYYQQNGKVISYGEALRLFSQMEADEKAAFEQYYKDETGYEIINFNGYDLIKNFSSGDHFASQSHYVGSKYTLEAYAKKNGMTIDPQWAGYSAEEIIQMADNGVNIPQDVVDAAHSILTSTASNMSETDAEDGDAEATTEREPFLNLIPKAQKKIQKCNENNEKIDDKIEDLLPEKNKRQKKLKSKMEDQRNSLKEYEAFMREWRTIQNKINNGEELTESEAKRYAQLTGMLNEDNSKQKGFEIDKREIAKSLNELNILAALGEKLAVETIEIGDTLADYTSKANYKTTRNQASGQIGFFAAIIAMAQGKNLAQEANTIGNDTKEYTDETHQSVLDIAKIVGVENSIADTKGNSAEDEAQVSQEASETVEAKQAEETSPENNEEKTENDAAEKTNDTIEEDFILNDESVLKLIDEAGVTNDELREQIIFALQSIKDAKSYNAFAKFADKKIQKLVNEFNKQEEARQQKIQKLEDENNNINEEKERIPQAVVTDETKEQQNEKTLDNNNNEIEELKAESQKAKEDFKAKTANEKSVLNDAIPTEDEAFNINIEFKNTLPELTEQLDFTSASGISLAKIGTYMFEMGLNQMMGFMFSRRALWLMSSGLKSMSIGHTANKEATKPYLEVATKATDTATTATSEALADLSSLDAKIVSVTGDDAAETPASDEQETEGENTENGVVEANTEASVNGMEDKSEPAAQPAAVKTQSVKAPTVQTPADAPKAEKASATQNEPVKGGALGRMIAASHSEKDRIKAIAEQGNNTKTPSTKDSSTKSVKPEDQDARKAGPALEKDSDKSNDAVKNANNIAKDDNKDSQNTLKETQKDKKTLEKDAKKLQKQLKNDEKNVIKMTKESMEAAKKQEQILAEYETLVAENEQMIAEDESKQQSQAAIGAPQQQNNTDNQGQGSSLASSTITAGAAIQGQSNNTDKLNQNGQRINELGVQFKIYGNTIDRNQTKIKRIQKSTKTKQKKLKKTTKALEKRIKADEKKEQDKQKRLAKQLAIVGIQENVFSLVNAVGTIYTLITAPSLLSNPFTAPVGAATLTIGQMLMAIGTAGIAACGVTKAIINLANGNLTAALMGLGTTAVSATTSFVGGGAAVNTVLTAVSTGLSVVSTSANLVNNVRQVQGKEASGLFSKIATIAGVAGSLTNAAASLKDIGNAADTFGKALTIASVTGTVLSSASQIMSEFGADGKFAEILGMVGGGIQLAASVAQIAQKFSGAEAKNDDNKDKSEETTPDNEGTKPDKTGDEEDTSKPDDTKPDKTDKTDKTDDKKPEKTREEKRAEKEQKKRADKEAKEAKKAQEKQKKEAEKARKQQEKEQKKAELEDAKQAKNNKQEEAKGVKDKDAKKNMTKNGASKEYADIDDDQLEDFRLEAIGQGNEELASKYAAEQQQRADYKAKMGILDANSQAKKDKFDTIMKTASTGVDMGMKVYSMLSSGNKQDQQQGKRRGYVSPGKLDKRIKRIRKIRKIQQQHARNYQYKKAS